MTAQPGLWGEDQAPRDITPVHPARFSREIIAELGELIPPSQHVHDPFGGTGERLGVLCDHLGVTFTGTEIEPEFIIDGRVRCGDSTDPATYPTRPYTIVTSPVYPNGIADHFAARDGSRRNTYRWRLAQITGEDRPLHPNNQGRYGYRGRNQMSQVRRTYWRIADEVVACWSGATLAIVNTSDFLVGGVVEPVTVPWRARLERHGWTICEVRRVTTRRNRYGANGSSRVDGEDVIVATREFDASDRAGVRVTAPDSSPPVNASGST